MYNKINNKGFTLVELLATIAILAIISVISFVSINGVIEQNKIKNCENLEKSIKSAAKEYVSDKRYDNSFINSVSGMKVLVTAEQLISNMNLSDSVFNPFDNSEDITDEVIVEVELYDNDYTIKKIDVYRKILNDAGTTENKNFVCNKNEW